MKRLLTPAERETRASVREEKRKRRERAARKARADKALSVAHGAWGDFALQLPGDTEEERNLNRAMAEFNGDAFVAFARVYHMEIEGL